MPEKDKPALDAPIDESRILAVTTAKGVEWAEVAADYGETWDFEQNDTLIGQVVQRRTIEQPDINDPSGNTMRNVNIYDLVDAQGDRYSVWGTWSIDNKMQHVPDGAIIRIRYKGEQSFMTDAKQPRTVKRFAVSVAALPAGA